MNCAACDNEGSRMDGDKARCSDCRECVAEALVKGKPMGMFTEYEAKKLCACYEAGHDKSKIRKLSPLPASIKVVKG